MHNMALQLLQPTALLQPTTLLQPMPRLHAIPVEPTVALLVRPIALRPIQALPLLSMPVVQPYPLALVGSPMPLLLNHMPLKRGNMCTTHVDINRGYGYQAPCKK